MAYGYLLAPSFQFININGRPIANGHVEVFLTNTDTKYITKCDFNGTDNPFKVPLNSKGMAVVIASGDYAYDVFCYDRFGSLFWSGTGLAICNVGTTITGVELPMRIVGDKITNNGICLTCTGKNAWAEGDNTTASGNHSHSEGSRTIASGDNAHAEGGDTRATGEHSHAEGFRTKAGSYGHAEGAGTEASNVASHAEGRDTKASGEASHAEGRLSTASGDYSHASGYGTRATGEGSTAVGKYNDDGDALFGVGNGTNTNNRKDVFKVDRDGNTWLMNDGVLTKVENVKKPVQFVLIRENMTDAFTAKEYQDCVNAANEGMAVCVQYSSEGISQINLVNIRDDGSLEFSFSKNDKIYTYVVSPNNSHYIVFTTKTITNPNAVLNVKLGGQTRTYTPTGSNLSLDIDSEVSRIYIAKGSASVSTLNAGISGIQNGWSYVLTDNGTLTLGGVSVSAGDNVAWDGSKWFKVGNQVNINVLYVIQNDEYLYAITDSNGVLLFSIMKDGSVDWAKGIPEHIRKPLEQIFEIIPNKVDKVTGKSLIDSTFADEISIISNEEYLFAIVDSAERILFSIDKRGQVDFQSGLPDSLSKYVEQLDNKVEKEDGKSLINSTFSEGISVKQNLNEYAYVITDDNDRVLFGITNDGSIEGKFEEGEVQFFNNVEEMKKCKNPKLRYAVTMGFYNVGDGGAAKYVVGAGVENGFSSFMLESGLVARLVIEENYLYPEQVGYTNSDRTKDLRTYLFYITRDLLIDVVRFYNRGYYLNGPWIVPRQGISLIGSSNSGNPQNDGIYYFSRIYYSSTRTDNGACAFNCEYREFRLENIELRNLDAEDPTKPPRIGIYTLNFNDDPSSPNYHHNDHYDMIIKNVRIGGFEYGLNLTGNIKWNLQLDNVRCSSCTYGCRIFGHVLVATFKLFYPDHCKVGVLIDTLSVAVSFLYCNFGTTERCIVFENGIESSPYGQYTFVGCNFELDEVPSSPRQALYLDVEESYRAMITMIGCNFNFGLIGQSQYTNQCFCFKLSDQTELTIIGCQQSDPRWNDQLFNPTYPAKKKLGSVKILNSENVVRPNYSAEYVPTFDIDGSIITESLQILNEHYSNAPAGIIVYDVNADKAYVKLSQTYKEI